PLRVRCANALTKVPQKEVLAALEKNLDGKTGDAARRARLQVLGYVGTAEELTQVFELALHEGETAIAPALAEELRATFAGILVRDPEVAQARLLSGWKRLGE